MVWIFALLLGLALVFFKLGSASVWVGILAFGLKLTFVVIGFLIGVVIWQKWKIKRNKVEGL